MVESHANRLFLLTFFLFEEFLAINDISSAPSRRVGYASVAKSHHFLQNSIVCTFSNSSTLPARCQGTGRRV